MTSVLQGKDGAGGGQPHTLKLPPSVAYSPLVMALVLTIVVIFATLTHIPQRDSDSIWYLALAQGRMATVIAPFSKRFFYPFLARGLAVVLRCNLASAFTALAYVSCFTLLLSVSSAVKRSGTAAFLCVPFLLTPLLVEEVLHAYLPDLFHSALLGLFFYLYAIDKWRAAMPVLLMAMLTRESTLLLCLVIVVLELIWGRRRVAISTALTAVVGTLICGQVGTHGQPNIHALGTYSFMVLKIPYNFLKNWFGIVLWTNTFVWKSATAVSLRLPRWLPAGRIRQIGLAPWSPAGPLTNILTLFTEFGLGTSVAIRALQQDCRGFLLGTSRTVRLSFCYGSLAAALGTTSGSGIERLVGYGWPAFWIAIPILVTLDGPLRPPSLPGFLLAHLVLCWMPALVALLIGTDTLYLLPQIAIAGAVHAYAWKNLMPRAVPLEAASLTAT